MTRASQQSELELQVELYAARRLGCNGVSKVSGCDHSNIGNIVGVIQHVECVQANGECPSFFTLSREHKIVLRIQIKIDKARSGHGVARVTRRTIVDDAVVPCPP